MKKIIAGFCIVSLLAGTLLWGCSGKPKADTKEGYKIGFSNYSVGNSWRQQMEAEFKQRAEELKSQGVISEYVMLNADNDQTKQIADINDLITMGVNAIVVTCITEDGLNGVLEDAVNEGIKVIAFDNVCTTDKVDSKVSADDYGFGEECGKWMGEKLKDGGKVVILDGIAGTSTSVNRKEGAVKALNETSPSVEVLTSVNCDWDYATAKAAMENILSTYPKIDGVLSLGGEMTRAAIDAFLAANRELVPMTGEGSNGFLRTWKENESKGFSSMAFVAPTYMSSTALDYAVDALEGKEIPKEHLDVQDPVTEDTLGDFYRSDLSDNFWVGTKLNDDTLKEMFGK